jgi:hypothetical protein
MMTNVRDIARHYCVSEDRIFKFTNEAGFDWYIADPEEGSLMEREAFLVRGVRVAGGTLHDAKVVIGDWPPTEGDIAWAALYTSRCDREDGLI